MRVIFIGAGAIGQLFASKIAINHPNAEVSVFVSKRMQNIIKKNGIILETLQSERIKIENLEIGSDIFKERDSDSYKKQFVFITSKAYDNENISVMYEHIILKADGLIILQNGIGNEVPFIQNHPNLPIYRMTTRIGALISAPGIIKHTGDGITYLGCIQNSIDDDLKELYSLMNQSGFSIIISNNIQKVIWEKLLINIPINAVGALTHNRNGILLNNHGLLDIMFKLFDEAVRVAHAEQIQMENENHLFQKVLDVLERTSGNKNSMLADLEHGRRTEIDYINGKISEFGKKHGISTPFNEMIVALIKGYNLND